MWPGVWVNQMSKMNQAVGEKNYLDKLVGGKCPVHHCTMSKFWKFIGCILLSVTFGVKEHHIWRKIDACVSKKIWDTLWTPLHRDFHGKTDILNVRCYLYHPRWFYAFHWTILSNTKSFIYWILLWVLIFHSLIGLRCFLDKFLVVQGVFPWSFTTLTLKVIDKFCKV